MTDFIWPWPITVLRPRQITRDLVARTTSGTVSASGFTQRVSVPAHVWRIKYDGILLTRPEEILRWDALAAQLDGAANPVLVPLVERAAWKMPANPFTDDTMFSDGSSYEDQGGLIANVVGTAHAGETEITINFNQDDGGVNGLAGHHFSIGKRLYRIALLAFHDGSGNHTIRIRPPLREDVFDTAVVDFDTLVCKCRLATDNEMSLTLDPAGMGTGTVNFVEDPR